MKKSRLLKIVFAALLVASTITIVKADTDDDSGGPHISCPDGNKYVCATTPYGTAYKGDGGTPVTF